MKLPNVEYLYVPPEKITEYLLDMEHENGRGKALFFIHFGFSVAQWEELASALIRHAHENEVTKQETTPFGTRYVIEGILHTPVQRTPQVRVVWFIPKNEERPHLATAYPLEEIND